MDSRSRARPGRPRQDGSGRAPPFFGGGRRGLDGGLGASAPPVRAVHRPFPSAGPSRPPALPVHQPFRYVGPSGTSGARAGSRGRRYRGAVVTTVAVVIAVRDSGWVASPPGGPQPRTDPDSRRGAPPRDALLTDRPFLAVLALPDGRTRSPHRHAIVRPVIVSTQPGEWPPGPWPGVSRSPLPLSGPIRSRQPCQPHQSRRLRGISSRRQRRAVPRAQRESGTVHRRRAVELPRPRGAREVCPPARRPLWTRRPPPH